MPKINIIIPCYKVEKYLSDCLDCLIAQTFMDWQAICVDDGSPDNCGKILDEYAKKDKRFIVIHQHNKGLAGARNVAYPYLRAFYTMFLDSDDLLAPQALEILYQQITKTGADIMWFDYQRFYDDTSLETRKDFKQLYIINNPYEFYINQRNSKIKMREMVWNKIYKTEYVKLVPFALGISPHEDNLFTFELMTKIKKLAYLPLELYFYRMRETSIIHNIDDAKLRKNWILVFEQYRRILADVMHHTNDESRIIEMKTYFTEALFYRAIFKRFISHKELHTPQYRSFISSLLDDELFDFSNIRFSYRLRLSLYKLQEKLSKASPPRLSCTNLNPQQILYLNDKLRNFLSTKSFLLNYCGVR